MRFLWKRKLRIPDIYENRENQLAFGRFLDACACCSGEVRFSWRSAGSRSRKSRAWGRPPRTCSIPAPHDHATVQHSHRQRVQRDRCRAGQVGQLGRLTRSERRARKPGRRCRRPGTGIGRTPRCRAGCGTSATRSVSRSGSRPTAVPAPAGRAGWPTAASRRCRVSWSRATERTPSVSDVLWMDSATGQVAAAFEVEQYHVHLFRDCAPARSGARLAGLVRHAALPGRAGRSRGRGARPAQRQAFRRVGDLELKYLPYGELGRNREAMARFGQGLQPLDTVARRLA